MFRGVLEIAISESVQMDLFGQKGKLTVAQRDTNE
jgi:hypothetical protein